MLHAFHVRLVAAAAAILFLGLAPIARSQTPEIEELKRKLAELEESLGDKGSDQVPPRSRVRDISSGRYEPVQPQAVVKMYDLSDLFQSAPAYAADLRTDLAPGAAIAFSPSHGVMYSGGGFGGGFGGGGMGGGLGGGGGFYSVKDGQHPPATLDRPSSWDTLRQSGSSSDGRGAGPRTSLDELIAVIQQVIEPELWKSGGATISRLGTNLVVSADASAHDQIEKLLASIREKWASLRTITLQAHWLWLTDAELAALIGDPAGASAETPFGTVAAGQWSDVLDNMKPDPRPYRAAITCYNGQTVHVACGGQRLAVTNVESEWGGESMSPLIAPTVLPLEEGAVLQVTPTATKAGKYVILDVHSRVTRERPRPVAARADEEPSRPANQPIRPDDLVNVLDPATVDHHRLSTTLRVPVNRTFLVGGMTSGESESPTQALYLFVRVAMQELRDDQPAPEASVPGPGQPSP